MITLTFEEAFLLARYITFLETVNSVLMEAPRFTKGEDQ